MGNKFSEIQSIYKNRVDPLDSFASRIFMLSFAEKPCTGVVGITHEILEESARRGLKLDPKSVRYSIAMISDVVSVDELYSALADLKGMESADFIMELILNRTDISKEKKIQTLFEYIHRISNPDVYSKVFGMLSRDELFPIGRTLWQDMMKKNLKPTSNILNTIPELVDASMKQGCGNRIRLAELGRFSEEVLGYRVSKLPGSLLDSKDHGILLRSMCLGNRFTEALGYFSSIRRNSGFRSQDDRATVLSMCEHMLQCDGKIKNDLSVLLCSEAYKYGSQVFQEFLKTFPMESRNFEFYSNVMKCFLKYGSVDKECYTFVSGLWDESLELLGADALPLSEMFLLIQHLSPCDIEECLTTLDNLEARSVENPSHYLIILIALRDSKSPGRFFKALSVLQRMEEKNVPIDEDCLQLALEICIDSKDLYGIHSVLRQTIAHGYRVSCLAFKNKFPGMDLNDFVDKLAEFGIKDLTWIHFGEMLQLCNSEKDRLLDVFNKMEERGLKFPPLSILFQEINKVPSEPESVSDYIYREFCDGYSPLSTLANQLLLLYAHQKDWEKFSEVLAFFSKETGRFSQSSIANDTLQESISLMCKTLPVGKISELLEDNEWILSHEVALICLQRFLSSKHCFRHSRRLFQSMARQSLLHPLVLKLTDVSLVERGDYSLWMKFIAMLVNDLETLRVPRMDGFESIFVHSLLSVGNSLSEGSNRSVLEKMGDCLVREDVIHKHRNFGPNVQILFNAIVGGWIKGPKSSFPKNITKLADSGLFLEETNRMVLFNYFIEQKLYFDAIDLYTRYFRGSQNEFVCNSTLVACQRLGNDSLALSILDKAIASKMTFNPRIVKYGVDLYMASNMFDKAADLLVSSELGQ